MEYTASRNPSRWLQTPILASTNGHFKATGLFPIFGQHKLHSFIGRGCSVICAPRNYVVWSLDTKTPAPPVKCEAMSQASVSDRAQRDMIPDHEMHKYQPHLAQATTDDQSGTTTEDDQSRGQISGAGTNSEDYDSITVFISELPTPRPFAPGTGASAVLSSGFFALDPDSESSPDVAHGRPAAPAAAVSSHHDFSPSPPYHARAVTDAMTLHEIPMVPLYSSPKDSHARRTARPRRLEDSAE